MCTYFGTDYFDPDCDGVSGATGDVSAMIGYLVGRTTPCLIGDANLGDLTGDGQTSLKDALFGAQCTVGRRNIVCPDRPHDFDVVEHYAYLVSIGGHPPRSIFEQLDTNSDGAIGRLEVKRALLSDLPHSHLARILASTMYADPGLFGITERGVDVETSDVWWSFSIPSPSEIEGINDGLGLGEAMDEDELPLVAAAGVVPLIAKGSLSALTRVAGVTAGTVLLLNGDSSIVGEQFEVWARNAWGDLTFVSHNLDDLVSTALALTDGSTAVLFDNKAGQVVELAPDGTIEYEGGRIDLEPFRDRDDYQEVLKSLLRRWRPDFRDALGGRKHDGCDAHHIVAKASSYGAAAEAREILFAHGVGVHDPVNGALLARAGHSKLHTHGEMDRVLRLVRGAVAGKTGPAATASLRTALDQEGRRLEREYPCGSFG